MVVDDQSLVREGIKSILSRRPDFRIVGETGDASQALEMVAGLNPDVVVLNFHMLGTNGPLMAREIRRRSSRARILVVTQYSWSDWVTEIFRSGATGYVLSGIGSDDLIWAVEAVARGQTYLAPPVAEVIRRRGWENPSPEEPEPLTQRERQVLELIASGETVQGVAKHLSVSPRTVQTHLTHIMGKAGVHNRAELVRYAIRRGIVRVD